MKIGLIYYSGTGNTRIVAEGLKEKLESKGHTAVIDEITIEGKTPAQAGKFELTHIPDPLSYDAVVFGAPVQALTLNPVMKAYLEKLPVMNNLKAAVFITKQLPLLWAGGTGAVAQVKKALEARGAEIIETEIVVWSEKKREKSIRQCLESIGNLFNG
ncbi:MAG: flavodoxin family protein [Bacillota bacterium]